MQNIFYGINHGQYLSNFTFFVKYTNTSNYLVVILRENK